MTDQPRQPRSAAKQSAGLYLEDLFVGQHFTSGTDTMDEDLIKAFATEFDPQPISPRRDGCAGYRVSGIGRERLAYSGSDDAPLVTGGTPAGQWNYWLGWGFDVPNPTRPEILCA